MTLPPPVDQSVTSETNQLRKGGPLSHGGANTLCSVSSRAPCGVRLSQILAGAQPSVAPSSTSSCFPPHFLLGPLLSTLHAGTPASELRTRSSLTRDRCYQNLSKRQWFRWAVQAISRRAWLSLGICKIRGSEIGGE